MNFGNLEKLVLIGLVVALVVTAGVLIYADFGNSYGFDNETNSQFRNLVNYTEIQDMISYAQNETSRTQDPSIVQVAEMMFTGGYFAIKSFFNLPTVLTGMASKALSLFGIPSEFNIYIYGIISIIVLFAVLAGLGVLKRP